MTYTVASSCVCTSPLAVMTIEGLHDFVKVSISASFKSFLLIICIDAPESTTNSLSSGLIVDGEGRLQFSEGPLLRRPSFINIPFWVAWWVCAYNGSYFSACRLRGVWLSCLVFTGISDAVEDSATGVLSVHRETKFIIGFDFAVTLSSPESFCVLFDITSEHSAERKWLMSNKHKRWFHSSRVKFPLVSLQLGIWCQCNWFGFWGPNWFDRRTNQEQLCGFWKHVSL